MNTVLSLVPTLARSFAVLALLPAAALAQSPVLVVDDNSGAGVDFTDIQFAVNAANDGDTVLVKDGTYTGFSVDGKSLRIVAENDTLPRIDGTVFVRNVAAGQRVALRGLTITSLTGDGILLEDCTGNVWIERCSATGSDGPNWFDVSQALTPGFGLGKPGLRAEQCSSVSLHRSQFYGGDGGRPSFVLPDNGDGGSGILLVDSNVTARATLGTGGAGGGTPTPQLMGSFGIDGGDGGHGVEVIGGVLQTAGSAYEGGNGGDAEWTIDFLLIKLDLGEAGDGGDGVHATDSSPVLRYQDSASFGGLAGVEYDPLTDVLLPGDDGVAFEATGASVTLLPGDAFRWYSAQGVVRSGDVLTFTQTQPPVAGPTVLGIGLFPTTLWQPALNGNVVIQPLTYLFDPVFVSVPGMPLTHEYKVPVNVPLPPGTSMAVFTQMVRVDPTTLLPALSSGSTVTILDPTL